MKLSIQFDIDNDQFVVTDPEIIHDAAAVAKVVTKVAADIHRESSLGEGDCGTIFDENGNRIGKWAVLV